MSDKTSQQCSICGVAYLNGQQQCTCNAGPLQALTSNQQARDVKFALKLADRHRKQPNPSRGNYSCHPWWVVVLADEIGQLIQNDGAMQRRLTEVLTDRDRLREVNQEALRKGGSLLVKYRHDNERLRGALEILLPGLVLDLRYADVDDDKDAMRARIQTVQEALSGAPASAPQAPVFRVVLSGGQIVGATPLAPGLPDGEHELYCEPSVVAPYLRSAPETSGDPDWRADAIALRGECADKALTIESLRDAVRALLAAPMVADIAPGDRDPEDIAAESLARKVLQGPHVETACRHEWVCMVGGIRCAKCGDQMPALALPAETSPGPRFKIGDDVLVKRWNAPARIAGYIYKLEPPFTYPEAEADLMPSPCDQSPEETSAKRAAGVVCATHGTFPDFTLCPECRPKTKLPNER